MRGRRRSLLRSAPLVVAVGLLLQSRGASAAPARIQTKVPSVPPGRVARGTGSTASPVGAHLNYYGGRVVSNIQVVQVIYGAGSFLPEVTSTATPSMATFYQGVLNSAYVDWLTEYDTRGLPPPSSNQSIGRGSFATQVVITPSPDNSFPTIMDFQIRNELSAKIQSGAIPPPTQDAAGNNNTYYAIFFPAGKRLRLPGGPPCSGGVCMSCRDFCAYHGTLTVKAPTSTPGAFVDREVYFGVHPDLRAGSGCETACGSAPTVFGNYTQVASHELVETMTDPEVDFAATLGPPVAWYDPIYAEASDICNGDHATVVGGDGVSYDVQTTFSNRANACVVTGPPAAVPAVPALARWAVALLAGALSLAAVRLRRADSGQVRRTDGRSWL